jgi:hypothetical protein
MLAETANGWTLIARDGKKLGDETAAGLCLSARPHPEAPTSDSDPKGSLRDRIVHGSPEIAGAGQVAGSKPGRGLLRYV